MHRRATFFGDISWSDKSVRIEDRIALEKVSAEFPDAVVDACATDTCAFILTHKQLFRLDNSSLRLFALSLEDICSGWAVSSVKCVRSDAAGERLNHFGLRRQAAKERAVTKSLDRPDALVACTDKTAFLAVNRENSTRLFRVFDAIDDSAAPALIQLGLADSVSLLQMVCGKAHTVLLDSDGRVLTFGVGSRGELGHGAVASEQEPKIIDALVELGVVFVAAGGWHSVAVTDDGDVYFWGWNDCGQLGKYIIVEDNLHSMRLRKSMRSSDSNYPLPEGAAVMTQMKVGTSSSPLPLDLHEGIRVRKVACGARHTLLLTDDRVAFACGINNYGQIGRKSSPSLLALYCVGENVGDIDAAGWTTILYE